MSTETSAEFNQGLVLGLAMQPLTAAVITPGAGAMYDYEYISDNSVRYNDITYTIEKDSETGLINQITDSAGNTFKPTLNSGITDTAFHNAVIMAIAMHGGIKQTLEFDYTGIFAYYDMTTLSLNSATWKNSLSSNYNIALTGGTAENNCLHLTENDYGVLTCTEPMTIYALFKTISTGDYHSVISKHMTSYADCCDFAIVINPNIILSGRNSNVISTVTAATSHVVCITRSTENAKLYIDGEYIGSSKTKLADYYGEYTLNKSLRGSGIGDTPGEHYYRMLAIGNAEHTAEQIAANSKYILAKYGSI